MGPRHPLGIALGATLLAAAPGAAVQAPRASPTVAVEGDLTLLSTNVLLAGLTAGVSRALRGGSFLDGLLQGGAGGAVAYTGRRIAAARTFGMGMLGRQVHAVGTSVVRNGSTGAGPFDSVVLPVGPLRLEVGRRPAPEPPRLRVSATEILMSVWAFTRSELTLDAGESVSSGALVFESDEFIEVWGGPVQGVAFGGVVLLGGVGDRPLTLAHERVHILQHDFASRVWTGPVEDWLLDVVPAGGRVPGWLQPDVLGPGLVASLASLGSLHADDVPWEVEARSLTER